MRTPSDVQRSVRGRPAGPAAAAGGSAGAHRHLRPRGLRPRALAGRVIGLVGLVDGALVERDAGVSQRVLTVASTSPVSSTWRSTWVTCSAWMAACWRPARSAGPTRRRRHRAWRWARPARAPQRRRRRARRVRLPRPWAVVTFPTGAFLHRRMEERASGGTLRPPSGRGSRAPRARRRRRCGARPGRAHRACSASTPSSGTSLIERGRQQGSIHAEQVTHVLRHVELTGDVLARSSTLTEAGHLASTSASTRPTWPTTRRRAAHRPGRLDDERRRRRAPAQPPPAPPRPQGRRRGPRAARPTACACTCARSARSTC